MAARTKIARNVWSICHVQPARGGSARSFCGAVGSIKVNNIPEWAPPEATAAPLLALPYKNCTILTVLDSVGMSGRAECRQGVCRKCAMNVRVGDSEELIEVLTCQEVATNGLIVDMPDGWQPKPRWCDPHPEKIRITTRELKATSAIRNSSMLGKKLKNSVRAGNFAFKQERWADASKAIDDIDAAMEKYGFQSYLEFAATTTLARDVVPDFLESMKLLPMVNGFEDRFPPTLAEKAGDLSGHMKDALENAGTSAAAYCGDMDENTIGSHGVGKKGAQGEINDGGAAATALEAAAFYRNFSTWPIIGEAPQDHIEETGDRQEVGAPWK